MQLDPRLSPNFSVIDLTGPQIRRNRDLRALLLQVYIVCPALLSLLVLAVLLPLPRGEGLAAVASVSNIFAMGYLVSVLLGIGAAFVGFLILAFQAIVQGSALRAFGIISFGHAVALSAVCAWAFVSLCAVFPRHRSLPIWREVTVAFLAALFTVIAYTGVMLLAAPRGHIYHALALGFVSFVFVTLVIGMRWRRWSRGFVFGQIVGILTGAGYYALLSKSFSASPVAQDVVTGLTSGAFSAVLWAFAFALAETLGDSRSAIASGLLVTIALNNPGTAAILPFIVLWTTYGWMRYRSAQKDRR